MSALRGNVDEIEILQRKIELKRQAALLILKERQELKQRLCLLRIREGLLKSMGPEFDRELSGKLDCVDCLLR